MKFVKKTIYILLSLLLLITAILWTYLYSLKPVYNGELQISSLYEETKVHFDEFGIPHIYAQNEEDAFRALGYVHAQDRLFQMELLRRVGAGRLSEILGKDLVEVDRLFRTIGIEQHANESLAAFENDKGKPYYKAAVAYIEGINEFIENGKTPIEFTLIGIPKEKFTAKDIFLVTGYMSFSFALALRTDPLITRIHQKYGDKYLADLLMEQEQGGLKIPVYKPDSAKKEISENIFKDKSITALLDKIPVPMWIGSNSWVVGPQKTKSGQVLFCNDTHIGYAQPSVWYEAHMEYPGHRIYGNHIAGMPFPFIGHNEHAAIGLTMFENDDIDLYREKRNPENLMQVWVNDHWEDMQKRQEVIYIKGGENIEFDVLTTRHGPVINDAVKDIAAVETEPVSFWWVYTKFPTKNVEAAYVFSHAKKMDEARNAVSMIIAPGLNVMYGDKDGNIAWWATAKLVKRPPHVNPAVILDGASGNDESLGYYDFSENPQCENPPFGYVYSANNQTDTSAGILYPGYYVPDHRAERIVQHLSSEKIWDTEEMKKMITETYSSAYPRMIKEIINLINTEIVNKSDLNKKAVEILSRWDGNHSLEDIAPVIFYKLLYRILENTFADEMGEEDFNAFLLTHLYKRNLPFYLSTDSLVFGIM
jgi:penicillin G amidase